MPSDEELISILQRSFRLTTYEARVYLALLRGASSPKEASVMSGVPLPRVYDVVRVLESKGLAVPSSEGWYKYVPPRAAAVAEIARIEEESRSKVRSIIKAAEVLESIVQSPEKPVEPVIVDSPYQVISLAAEALRETDNVYINIVYVLRDYPNIVRTIAGEAAKLGRAIYLISKPPMDIGGDVIVLEREVPMPDAIIMAARGIFLYPGGPTGIRAVVVSDRSYLSLVLDRLRKHIS
ncbi:MAG: hypothetical protein F7B20_00385 [Aeropyrum sp.]|nr:hypothetical protein [Aeropyrum sp.]MCE4615982.1 hypothetical protein [Aeropyrum sp.]